MLAIPWGQRHRNAVLRWTPNELIGSGQLQLLLFLCFLFIQVRYLMLCHWVEGGRHLQLSISYTTESFKNFWQEPPSAVTSALLTLGPYCLESGTRQMDRLPCVCFPGSCFPTALANLDQVISRSGSSALDTFHR